jgi:hypothetical protein
MVKRCTFGQAQNQLFFMDHTNSQFKAIIEECRELFQKKTHDYGTAWRILRLPSLTDQIFIKAQRLRSIEQKGEQKVEDDLRGEYIGIINYCTMALIQLEIGVAEQADMSEEEALEHYDGYTTRAFDLMNNKNHDYGEAWRDMRISSLTDLILQKLLRVKQIEDNAGSTLVSEGLDANYLDMINYAVFALIKMSEK